jgi:hypothetical protein
MRRKWDASNEEILAGFDKAISNIWTPGDELEEGTEQFKQYEQLHNELALNGITPIYDPRTGGLTCCNFNEEEN